MALSDNLLARWCPSIDDSPDDISGNANHGTYNGSMGTVADTGSGGSRAYEFDGTDDNISVNDTVTDGLALMTISLWVKPITLGSFEQFVSKYIGTSNRWQFACDTPAAKISFACNAGRMVSDSSVLSTGVWSHIMAVFNGSLAEDDRIDMYFNGTLAASTRSNTVDTVLGGAAATLVIGSRSDGNNWCNALIDDIAIWSDDKSADVATLYNSGSGRGLSYAGSSAPTFTQLERQIRGVNRGVHSGS